MKPQLPMTETIKCPTCAALLRYTPRLVATKTSCPKCKASITLPPAPPAPPPPVSIIPPPDNSDKSSWFVQTDAGDVFGPFSYGQLQTFVQQNRVVPASKLRNDSATKGEWIPAEHIPIVSRFFETSRVNTFDDLVSNTKTKVEFAGKRLIDTSTSHDAKDSWGVTGSVAGGISGGLLLVGLCFTPFACCAVPISIGGIVAAMFSTNPKLKKIGLIGNSIILFLSLAIVIFISVSMAWQLNEMQRKLNSLNY